MFRSDYQNEATIKKGSQWTFPISFDYYGLKYTKFL